MDPFGTGGDPASVQASCLRESGTRSSGARPVLPVAGVGRDRFDGRLVRRAPSGRSDPIRTLNGRSSGRSPGARRTRSVESPRCRRGCRVVIGRSEIGAHEHVLPGRWLGCRTRDLGVEPAGRLYHPDRPEAALSDGTIVEVERSERGARRCVVGWNPPRPDRHREAGLRVADGFVEDRRPVAQSCGRAIVVG